AAGTGAAAGARAAADLELGREELLQESEQSEGRQRRERLGARAKLLAVACAGRAVADVAAAGARQLSQALGRLRQFEPDLVAGEDARLAGLRQRHPRPDQ